MIKSAFTLRLISTCLILLFSIINSGCQNSLDELNSSLEREAYNNVYDKSSNVYVFRFTSDKFDNAYYVLNQKFNAPIASDTTKLSDKPFQIINVYDDEDICCVTVQTTSRGLIAVLGNSGENDRLKNIAVQRSDSKDQ